MRRTLAAVAATLACWPAGAQDLPFSTEATEACLAGAETASKRHCIGLAATICMDTPDGYTTVGMGYCYGREAEFWDDRLNAAYRSLRATERAIAEEMSALGVTAPDTASALREMQRAWIAWRDAACAYEYSTWGGGTGGGPAGLACMMQLTGEQALALEDRLEERNR